MSASEILIVYGSLLVTMLLCRCVPLFLLKGKELSPRVKEGIGLIPAAAFAALVANDLLQPTLLQTDWIAGITPIVAAVPVLFVAKKTGSLIWSAVIGMAVYALLLFATGR